MATTTAEVFITGDSQAIRLPRNFQIRAQEVYITQEEDCLIITPKIEQFKTEEDIENFFQAIHCPDFILERDNAPPQERESY